MSDEKPEAAVYKQISTEMRQGLRDIFERISTASKGQPLPPQIRMRYFWKHQANWTKC